MYSIEVSRSAKKELNNIEKHNQVFIINSLSDFIENFNDEYETILMQKGIIKKLKGKKEVLYRLKLRSYRIVYKKYKDKLIILILNITTREGAYK